MVVGEATERRPWSVMKPVRQAGEGLPFWRTLSRAARPNNKEQWLGRAPLALRLLSALDPWLCSFPHLRRDHECRTLLFRCLSGYILLSNDIPCFVLLLRETSGSAPPHLSRDRSTTTQHTPSLPLSSSDNMRDFSATVIDIVRHTLGKRAAQEQVRCPSSSLTNHRLTTRSWGM